MTRFQPHVLPVLKYLNQYLDDRPLCCCVDEISNLKKQMEGEQSEADDRDKIKLSQKTSSISLHVFKNDYYIKTKIKIPEDYPETQIRYSVLWNISIILTDLIFKRVKQ